MARITFTIRQAGTRYFATPTGQNEFYVGKSTRYGSFTGLGMAVREYYGPKFEATDYQQHINHWAVLLHASGQCESGNYFNVINSYDRAAFTFGFYQLAAHTPHDNLILLLRAAVGLREVADYYTGWQLHNGRLHESQQGGLRQDLEATNAAGTRNDALMRYLNPDLTQVDNPVEIEHAARLMHWSNTHKSFRDLQVQIANEIVRRKMKTYQARYSLDGKDDIICTAIADIHHHGRATVAEVRAALASADPREALIEVNQKYPQRNKNLRVAMAQLKARDLLGRKVYQAAANDFVDPPSA